MCVCSYPSMGDGGRVKCRKQSSLRSFCRRGSRVCSCSSVGAHTSGIPNFRRQEPLQPLGRWRSRSRGVLWLLGVSRTAPWVFSRCSFWEFQLLLGQRVGSLGWIWMETTLPTHTLQYKYVPILRFYSLGSSYYRWMWLFRGGLRLASIY
jgi:hypothetical protein